MNTPKNPSSVTNDECEDEAYGYEDELAGADFRTDPRVLEVIAFMKANLRRMIASNELAGLVGLSYSYLFSLFKADTKASPMEYLRRLKMEKAAKHLRDSRLSIKEIMGQVGYNTHKSFLRDFKRSFRVAPSEYRERFLAERARRLRGSKE